VALARMQTSQHPQLAELVNTLELGGQGTTVTLGFTVPPSVIDLLGKLKEQSTAPSVPAAAAPRRPLPPAL
jgi:hypothetical protein